MARPQFAGVDVLAGFKAEIDGNEAVGLLIQGPILVIAREPKNLALDLANDIERAQLVSAGHSVIGFGGVIGGLIIGLIGWAFRKSSAMQGEILLVPREHPRITLRGESAHIRLLCLALDKCGVPVEG